VTRISDFRLTAFVIQMTTALHLNQEVAGNRLQLDTMIEAGLIVKQIDSTDGV